MSERYAIVKEHESPGFAPLNPGNKAAAQVISR